MSGAVVSPLLKGLLRKLHSLVVDERITSTYHLKGELQRMVVTLQTLAAAAGDAEEQASHTTQLKSWMQRLQNVLYKADDLIDEVHIMVMVSSNDNDQLNQVSSSLSRRLINNSNFPPKSKLAPPLQHIRQDLVELAEEATHYGFQTHVNPADTSRRPRYAMYSYVDPQQVIGRGSDEEAVIDLILKSVAIADRTVSIVPIVGSGFIGKTTLAHLICNNSSLYDRFDLSLWVSLGDCHDMSDIQKTLRSQLSEDHRSEDDLDINQTKMDVQRLVENKRLLIVLDDFKDNALHMSVARDLITMLSKGSAIILTTRSRRAASLTGTTPAYRLQPLSSDASYNLFLQSRLYRGREPSDYIRIGRELVKLCSGIPPFLRMIGVLHFEIDTLMARKAFLEDVQEHGFGKIVEDKGWLYYDMFEIPSHLKLPLECFRLQKTCGLSVEALTCVWMALGFLYDSDDGTNQPPENIARKFLKDFVESALCPDVEFATGGVVKRITFNDAMYEFCTATAHQMWAILREGKRFEDSPLFIIWDQDCLRGTRMPSDQIHDPLKARLFMVRTGQRASLHFVRDIVSYFGNLRVLGIGGCGVDMLPDSIGRLKHLRYLDMGRNTRIKSLPESICDLWLLQTLFLHGCSQLEDLPAKIGRLQNLRYLTLTILKERLPEAIGQLTSLRTLGLSGCLRLASLTSINKLKNLDTLAIVNCPELDLASASSLEAFHGLDAIQTLLFSHLLKFASLFSYLGNPSVALRHLQISSCESMTEIEWITQFRSLRSLTIEDCPKLLDLRLTDGATQLDGLLELVIRKCPGLGYTAWITQFVSLRTLIIDCCTNLVDLDSGFSELKNLERLEVRGCPDLTKFWFESRGGKDWRRIAHVRFIEVDGACLES